MSPLSMPAGALGFSKDQCAGQIIMSYYGLKPKMYAMETLNVLEDKLKAKGVKTSSLRKYLTVQAGHPLPEALGRDDNEVAVFEAPRDNVWLGGQIWRGLQLVQGWNEEPLL